MLGMCKGRSGRGAVQSKRKFVWGKRNSNCRSTLWKNLVSTHHKSHPCPPVSTHKSHLCLPMSTHYKSHHVHQLGSGSQHCHPHQPWGISGASFSSSAKAPFQSKTMCNKALGRISYSENPSFSNQLTKEGRKEKCWEEIDLILTSPFRLGT